MIDADVVVLGAGVAGLACRMGLSDRRSVLCVEAEAEIGGLLRMHSRGGWIFDTAVHALFFRNPATQALVESLVPEGFHRFTKRNLVWQRGRVIEYPYQFNAHALDSEVRDECIRALPEPTVGEQPTLFSDWLKSQFGAGFYRHFFEPYNRKLYGVQPQELEAAPMTWMIPSDNRNAVLRGARAETARDEGSTACLYPRGRAGIHSIPRGLASRGRGEILLNESAVAVDVANRTLRTARGRSIRYRALVNTLPLPEFLNMTRGLPNELAEWGSRLAVRPVTVLRVAIANAGAGLDAHWTYFPDPDVPFYRLIRLERLSPDLAPAGSSACLLEYGGSQTPDTAVAIELCRSLGVAGDGPVDCVGHTRIPYGYVLFRPGHRDAVGRVLRDLAGHGIRSAGRYATWSYWNIEQTLESGLAAATAILRGG